MRSGRALAALCPIAGMSGILLGFALGWHGLEGLHAAAFGGAGAFGAAYFVGAVVTLAIYEFCLTRDIPIHAGKAAAVIGLLLFLPCWFLARLATRWTGC